MLSAADADVSRVPPLAALLTRRRGRADTVVGSAMRRGISGGQKRRVTSGAPDRASRRLAGLVLSQVG